MVIESGSSYRINVNAADFRLENDNLNVFLSIKTNKGTSQTYILPPYSTYDAAGALYGNTSILLRQGLQAELGKLTGYVSKKEQASQNPVIATGIIIDLTGSTGTLLGSTYASIEIFNVSGSDKVLTIKNSSTGATISTWTLISGGEPWSDYRRTLEGEAISCFTVDYPIGVKIIAKSK